MEDLFGILVFVIFAAVSIGSKLMKRRDERTPAPKWPGPVAGPGVPGYPRPSWPDASPRQQPAPPVARQSPPRPVAASGEGVSGGEGIGSGMEGAGLEGPGSTSAEAEALRFTEETDRIGTLARTAIVPEDIGRSEGVAVDLKDAFTDRSAVARAVVMAEVLGKPKALRRR